MLVSGGPRFELTVYGIRGEDKPEPSLNRNEAVTLISLIGVRAMELNLIVEKRKWVDEGRSYEMRGFRRV
jgi:hypothetical protein